MVTTGGWEWRLGHERLQKCHIHRTGITFSDTHEQKRDLRSAVRCAWLLSESPSRPFLFLPEDMYYSIDFLFAITLTFQALT